MTRALLECLSLTFQKFYNSRRNNFTVDYNLRMIKYKYYTDLKNYKYTHERWKRIERVFFFVVIIN